MENKGNQLIKHSNDCRKLSLEIYRDTSKAIDVRRKMTQIPEISKVLTPVERYVFEASTKDQICDIPDSELIPKLGQMFKLIALDVGYMLPKDDKSSWNYTCTRLYNLLKLYYGQLTLQDVKLAFELLITGELDEFLPKDRNGEAERKHYQQFNSEFFTRVLNAYKKKQSEIFGKAYAALPKPNVEMSFDKVKIYQKQAAETCLKVYLKYKYSGILDLGVSDDMIVYNWLLRVGLADYVSETEEDRKEAFAKYMARAVNGFVNKFTLAHVRQQGIESNEINYTAYEVARNKEIKRAFNRMIDDEIYIYDYLNYG